MGFYSYMQKVALLCRVLKDYIHLEKEQHFSLNYDDVC
jgi:hypothetical protein